MRLDRTNPISASFLFCLRLRNRLLHKPPVAGTAARYPGDGKSYGGPSLTPVFLSLAVCSMGNSTSRLYSVLAKTLSSGAVSQHQECLEQLDSAQLDPIDPKDLLEECQIVLQKRPPRFQRNFVHLKKNTASNHRPIRVMQWNILAQGRRVFVSSRYGLETKREGSELHEIQLTEGQGEYFEIVPFLLSRRKGKKVSPCSSDARGSPEFLP